jgi:uncharacterized protein with GYD domain
MGLYFMFGKYTNEGIQGISAKRTVEAATLIKRFRGEIKEVYSLLGEHDVVLIAELPGAEEAVKASVALGRLTGVSFKTSPAFRVEDFDKLVEEIE